MSIEDRIASDQPDSFAFSRENEAEIKRIIAKYPKGRQASAVMPLLDLAQRQHENWIPMKAIELIAGYGRDSCSRSGNFLHHVQSETGWKVFSAGLHDNALLVAWIR